jgi:hypothetical protein
MTDEADLPAVTPDESLARFVLDSRCVRADQTVKSDAFMPHPVRLDISVTRHIGLSEEELWQIGQAVADARPKTLYGRADFSAGVPLKLRLRVEPTREPKNHANIIGWPGDKPTQKSIAQQISAEAHYVARAQ